MGVLDGMSTEELKGILKTGVQSEPKEAHPLEYALPSFITGYQPEPGERTIWGDAFERPGAAVRSGIRSLVSGEGFTPGYTEGAKRPEEVQTFQDQILDKYYGAEGRDPNRLTTQVGGLGVSATGLAGDLLTNPADLILMLTGQQAVKGLGKTKPGAAVGRFMNKPRDPIKAIKNAFGRIQAGHIQETVAPKAYVKIQENIVAFKEPIQKEASKLGMSQSAINTIKQKGMAYAQTLRKKAGDSVDGISQRINDGISRLHDGISNAWKEVLSRVPEGHPMTLDKTKGALGGVLNRLGFLKDGKITTLAREKALKNTVYQKMIDLYNLISKPIVEQTGLLDAAGKPITRTTERVLSKEQWKMVRDMFGNLYKEKPTDMDLSVVRNALYADGEASGLKGLQSVRKASARMFKAEKKFQGGALTKEGTLKRYHKLAKQQQRDLDELASYIGDDFVDDLKVITAAQEADLIGKAIGSVEDFGAYLQKATNPIFHASKKRAMKPWLQGVTDETFKEILKYAGAQVTKQAVGGAAKLYLLYKVLRFANKGLGGSSGGDIGGGGSSHLPVGGG